MKICIVSDRHDRAALEVGLPMHVIHGNNLGDPVSLSRWARERPGMLHYHGPDARLELGGRRVFVVHYPDCAAGVGKWQT